MKKWKYLFYLSIASTAANTKHSAVALNTHAVTHIFRSSGKCENAERESISLQKLLTFTKLSDENVVSQRLQNVQDENIHSARML